MHDGHSNVYSFKVHDKTFVLKPMTPSQIIADNAKALVRAQEEKTQSEKSERVTQQTERERHKPNMSLQTNKSEMRGIQENPTQLHYVLICKGPYSATNTLTNIPLSLMSLLQDFW